MNNTINLQLIVHSTDAIKEYKGPKEDVDRLRDHLKVLGELPNGLSMISAGPDAPATTEHPWLKLDGSNNPIALLYHNGSKWTEMGPSIGVKSSLRSQYVQHGEFTFDFWGTADHWYSSDIFIKTGPDLLATEVKYGMVFKSEPIVVLQIRWGSIEDDTADHIFYIRTDNITVTGFKFMSMLAAPTIAIGSKVPVTISWFAMGEVSD